MWSTAVIETIPNIMLSLYRWQTFPLHEKSFCTIFNIFYGHERYDLVYLYILAFHEINWGSFWGSEHCYTHFSDTVDYEAHNLWVLEWGEEFGFQSVNLHGRVVPIFDSLIKWLHLELADFTWSCSLQSGACLSHPTLLWHCSGLYLWLVPRGCP